MTRRNEIESRLALIESQISVLDSERSSLNSELSNTPAPLLDYDAEAAVQAAITRKNDFLRSLGLLPALS